MMEETATAPPWLEALLSTAFFSVCPAHKDSPRSECNMYCLDCNDDAFCFYCRSSRHKDHHAIQIRRSSYHDVVRVSEIQNVLDINGIQTYVINSAKVMFLNERPQPKSVGKGTSHVCEICARSLVDPFRFCSLGCKLEGVKRNIRNTNFIVNGKNDEEVGRRERMAIRRLMPAKEDQEEEELRERGGLLQSTSTTPTHNSNSRRRKGIPHRAPLGS